VREGSGCGSARTGSELAVLGGLSVKIYKYVIQFIYLIHYCRIGYSFIHSFIHSFKGYEQSGDCDGDTAHSDCIGCCIDCYIVVVMVVVVSVVIIVILVGCGAGSGAGCSAGCGAGCSAGCSAGRVGDFNDVLSDDAEEIRISGSFIPRSGVS